MSNQPSTPQSYPVAATKLDFQGTLIHQPDPFQELELLIQLSRPTQTQPSQGMMSREQKTIYLPSHQRDYLSHDELADLVGASEASVTLLTEFLEKFEIKVVKTDLLARTVRVKGMIAAINKAFQVQIGVYQGPNRFVFLAYHDMLKVPANLISVVQNVTGITTLLKSEYRIPSDPEEEGDLQGSTPKGYTALQLAEAYKFPINKFKGKGQVIGIIELGGVYKKSDITTYFKKLGIKAPKIIEVGTPIDDSNLLNNSEVTLDLQVAGTVAPEATLVVYYGNTIAEAMKLAVQDTKNKPSVISISWAGSEYNYSKFQLNQLNEIFYEAALLGITVIAASGDSGGLNGKKFPNVNIPASNPLVLGCGGTNVTLNSDNSIKSEVVWNQNNGQIGSGGGYSHVYPLPAFQHAAVAAYPYAQGTTRGVPDVSANADGTNGYRVVFNGMDVVIGGTSAATPLVAGLIALINESLGYRLGFINTSIYQFAHEDAFFNITEGNNGVYHAAPGWSPATGLGTPNGQKLLELFTAQKKK